MRKRGTEEHIQCVCVRGALFVEVFMWVGRVSLRYLRERNGCDSVIVPVCVCVCCHGGWSFVTCSLWGLFFNTHTATHLLKLPE